MSHAAAAALGALAGATIFIGLPVGRIRGISKAVQGMLNAIATGVLLFLLWDILSHAAGPIEASLAAMHHGDRGFAALALIFAAGVGIGLLGLVYFKTNAYPEAEVIYRRLAEENSNVFILHSNLGLILFKQGKLDEAEHYLLRAVELRPNYAKSHLYLGLLYRQRKKFGLSLEHLRFAQQVGRRLGRREQPEPVQAARHDVVAAIGQRLDLLQRGHRTNLVDLGHRADFAPLADQDHPEVAALAHKLAIALLENVQRQHRAREQDGVQREEREDQGYLGRLAVALHLSIQLPATAASSLPAPSWRTAFSTRVVKAREVSPRRTSSGLPIRIVTGAGSGKR